MTRFRTTITSATLTAMALTSVGSPAVGRADTLATTTDATLATLVSTIELDADLAVADAVDWGDAWAAHVTGSADSSDEPGRYDDPFFLNWATFLPAYPVTDYRPSTEHECIPGNIQCVDGVIREMTRRYEQLGCDHNAVFALTYLRTTEEYKRYWETGAFDDPAWLNHYDAVFGQFYFDAYDDWYERDGAGTPPAWRIAFQAADAREVSGTGNLFLGMNGHIRRDLPFVLEAIGLTQRDGTTRKPDHDRVNEFLNHVSTYVMDEVAARHDPSMDRGVDVPFTTIDQTASIHVVVEWREEAWRKAELLLSAPTPADRERVAAEIENEAAASAVAIRHLFRQDSSDARDAHCEAWLAGN